MTLPGQYESGLDRGIGFRLSRTSRGLRQNWASRLKPLGVSPPQAAVLRGIAASPLVSLRELARQLGDDAMNVKRYIDSLERAGLVESGHRNGDRRSRTLALTAPGVALAYEINVLASEQREWIESLLGERNVSDLLATLGVIDAHIGDQP